MGTEIASPIIASDGRRFGKYRLMRQVGRGGQGVVYEAEDTALGRRVALKMLAPGIFGASPDLVRRFEREAEAASRLDHAGICAVYDFGREDGVPFMAMKYLEGRTLAQIVQRARRGEAEWSPTDPDPKSVVGGTTEIMCLDSYPTIPVTEAIHALPPRQDVSGELPSRREEVDHVVGVFEAVARALHSAHDAGIIHRDIKPGNIMVLPGGSPVIMDFGLAHGDWGDAVSLTHTGELFGTLPYMAPEQLRDREVGDDPRVDIYAVGVSLFECLTLRRPFEAATQEALFQMILTREPRDSRSLNPSIPRDLAVIVGTALDKDPDRRYRTAQDLADDLARFRARKPICARPATRTLRAYRWAQRNPALSMSLATILLLLVTGLGVSLGLLSRTLSSREDAEQARLRAQRRFNEVRALARYFIFDLHDAIQSLPGSTRLRQQVVAKALSYLDRLAQEVGDDPMLRAELAEAYAKVADVQGNPHNANLGNLTGAIDSYRKALDLIMRLFNGGHRNMSMAALRIRIQFNLADTLLETGQATAARTQYRSVSSLIDELRAEHPGDPIVADWVWRTCINEGTLALEDGDFDAADKALQEAMALASMVWEGDVPDALIRRPSMTHSLLGRVSVGRGDLEKALEHFREAARIDSLRKERFPKAPGPRRDHMVMVESMAEVFVTEGRLREAKVHLEEALADAEKVRASDPSDVRKNRDVAVLKVKLAGVSSRMGNHAPAIALQQDALLVLESLCQTDPENARSHLDLVQALGLSGEIFREAKFLEEALAAYDRARGLWDLTCSLLADRQNTERKSELLEGRADVLWALGQRDQAAAAFREAIALRESGQSDRDRRNLSLVCAQFADLLNECGKVDDALAVWERVLGIDRALVARRPSDKKWILDLGSTCLGMAPVVFALGDADRSTSLFKEACELFESGASTSLELRDFAICLRRSAVFFAARGDAMGARKSLERGQEVLRNLLGSGGATGVRSELASNLAAFGRIVRGADPEVAMRAYTECLGHNETLLGEEPGMALHAWNIASCHSHLAELAVEANAEPKAISHLVAAEEALLPIARRGDGAAARQVSVMAAQRAEQALKAHDLARAKSALEDARSHAESYLQAHADNDEMKRRLFGTLLRLVRLPAGTDGKELDSAYVRGEALGQDLLSRHPEDAELDADVFELQHARAESLARIGDVERALEFALRAHRRFECHPDKMSTMSRTGEANLRLLVRLCRELEQDDEARRWEAALRLLVSR